MSEKQQFLVTFQSDERTRWLVGPEQLAEVVKHLCVSAGEMHSDGAWPDVKVQALKCTLELVDAASLAALQTKAKIV